MRTFRDLFTELEKNNIPIDSNILVCPSMIVLNIQQDILEAAGLDAKTAEKVIDEFNNKRGFNRYFEIPDEVDLKIHSSGHPILEINGSLTTGLVDTSKFQSKLNS